jgi:hypothetical protein
LIGCGINPTTRLGSKAPAARNVSRGFLPPEFRISGLQMRAEFQTADHGGPSRNRERAKGGSLQPNYFRSVMVPAREFILRYSLIGLYRSRYFALAGRNCFSVFLDFEQFRAIRAKDDVANQADFSEKNGRRPKAAARLLTETAETTFAKMINIVSANNKLKTSDRPMLML